MPDLAHVSRLLADAHRLLSDQSLGRDELVVAIAIGKIAAAMKLLAETAERPEWPRPNIRVTGRKVAARIHGIALASVSPWRANQSATGRIMPGRHSAGQSGAP